jgi:hypothetical protein
MTTLKLLLAAHRLVVYQARSPADPLATTEVGESLVPFAGHLSGESRGDAAIVSAR